jgi:hypothetical protein
MSAISEEHEPAERVEATHANEYRTKDEDTKPKSSALNVIENPLQRVSEDKVLADAASFCEAHGLSDYTELFQRAALLARSPSPPFRSVSTLLPEELAALRYEQDHKWHEPFTLWYSIILCAIGAATQGWHLTGSNSANLSFPEEFGISGPGRNEWILGAVNSIIFLSAGFVCISLLVSYLGLY